MAEMYWITRMEYIQILFAILLIIGIAFTIASVINLYSDDFEQDHPLWKFLKSGILMVLVAALGLVFVPSTKDMLLIYGIGGTVDFLKDNSTAQQLPDKCIEALDKFMDEYMNEDNEK